MPQPKLPDPSAIFLIDEQLADLRNPADALTGIGVLLVSVSQLAFQQQRLGTYIWPERYPGQDGPTLNVAGAISDLNTGSFVKQRRLASRPVLQDVGLLKQSVNLQVIGTDRVRVGATGPATAYAAKHQLGLIDTVEIQPLARETLTKQRRKSTGPMLEALRTLGFIYSVDSITTKIVQRPFVGIPDETAEEIRELVVEELS